MASEERFVTYVRDQMSGAGTVTYRKMFGEYALYLDEKIVALVCDNQLFAKPLPSVRDLLGAVVEVAPYPGAKPHYHVTEQLEDQQLMAQLARITADALPLPKRRLASDKKSSSKKVSTSKPVGPANSVARRRL